jgi:hypothetical protein
MPETNPSDPTNQSSPQTVNISPLQHAPSATTASPSTNPNPNPNLTVEEVTQTLETVRTDLSDALASLSKAHNTLVHVSTAVKPLIVPADQEAASKELQSQAATIQSAGAMVRHVRREVGEFCIVDVYELDEEELQRVRRRRRRRSLG